jgi:hypothetical protein
MASLLDIGPLTASVTVRGKDINVVGIGADTLVQLLNDYPELKKYMSGLSSDVDANHLLEKVPDIADAIILSGAGLKRTDEKAVGIVKSLTIGEKVIILEPIMVMTFPKGFPAFTEALERIAGDQKEAGADASGKVPDTK